MAKRPDNGPPAISHLPSAMIPHLDSRDPGGVSRRTFLKTMAVGALGCSVPVQAADTAEASSILYNGIRLVHP